MKIDYQTNIATIYQIFDHLKECDKEYVPYLSTRVNLLEYATKLYEKGIRIEAWSEKQLIGLIGFYENKKDDCIFISNVSVSNKYYGMDIASTLMKMTIKFAESKNNSEIKLEVNERNGRAIKFYKKMGFNLNEGDKFNLLLKKI